MLRLWQLAVPRLQAAMQADKADQLCFLGAPYARDHGAQDPSNVFGALGIAAQPEEIVGDAARHNPRDTAQLHRLIARTQHTERIDRAVPQYPCVLAVAAPLHRDDRSFRFGDAHQPSRNRNPPAAGIEHVSAQHHAARVETSVVPHRRGGQSDLLLRDILVGAGPQLLGKLALLGLREFGAEDRLHAAGGKRRFHHHRVEMVEHPIERIILPAPPGGDGRKFELLAQQLRAEAGKKGHDRGSLNHSASQRVCHLHISRDDGVDQAGHAQKRIAAQFERIAKAIVHAAQDHIDLLQPVDCLQIHARRAPSGRLPPPA